MSDEKFTLNGMRAELQLFISERQEPGILNTLLYLHQDREGGRVGDLVFTKTTLREQARPSVLGEWPQHALLERTALSVKKKSLCLSQCD